MNSSEKREYADKLITKFVEEKNEEFGSSAFALGYLITVLSGLASDDDHVLKVVEMHFGDKK